MRPVGLALVDAPCSSSGVLRRHPGLRWSGAWNASTLGELAQLQLGLLEQAATLVSSPGRLVYATCSLLEVENRNVAIAFQTGSRGRGWVPWPLPDSFPGRLTPSGLAHTAQLWPHRHGTDGFFIARWRRTGVQRALQERPAPRADASDAEKPQQMLPRPPTLEPHVKQPSENLGDRYVRDAVNGWQLIQCRERRLGDLHLRVGDMGASRLVEASRQLNARDGVRAGASCAPHARDVWEGTELYALKGGPTEMGDTGGSVGSMTAVEMTMRSSPTPPQMHSIIMMPFAEDVGWDRRASSPPLSGAEAWQDSWQRRIEAWWAVTPYRDALQGCFGAPQRPRHRPP